MKEDSSLAESLKSLARAVEGELSAHPEATTLLVGSRGELAPSEAAVLEEHLTWCRECAGIWRDLPAFSAGDREPTGSQERAADWKALIARLEREARSERQDLSVEPARASWPRSARGVAAALAMALGFAAIWISNLSQRFANARAPLPNVPIYDLAPPAAERRGEEPSLKIDLERSALLILNLQAAMKDGTYVVHIVGEEGRIVWRIEGLEPTTFRNLVLQLPRGSLRPGVYQVQVWGSERATLAGKYTVEVVEPARQ